MERNGVGDSQCCVWCCRGGPVIIVGDLDLMTHKLQTVEHRIERVKVIEMKQVKRITI